MRVLELPSRLAYWGVPYRLVAGWETRGNEFPTRPDGALRHWIGAWGVGLRTVTYGRPDLPGPLAQTNQTREVHEPTGLDIVNVVASGKANHAGNGVLNGIVGNYKLLGLEIDWAGPSEAFGPMRKLTSELVMRAMLDCCLGDDPNDVGEHREYARPVGRKVDTNLSGDELRRRMTTITPPTTGDDFLSALTDQQQRDLYNQATKANGTLDDIKRRVTTIEDELLHFPEVDPDKMPVTGQRKNQFWELMASGGKLDAIVARLEAIEAELTGKV